MSDNEKTSDFKTGAVRSADANHLDFTSLPLIGLIGVARTAAEGGTKYGRYNYMQGMPVHDTLNHSVRHIFMYVLGDRSEPHLEHAAWGLLASIQQQVLDADVSAPHLLGPGATITEDVQEYLDFNAPGLAKRRKAGEFSEIGNWNLADLPEIKTILKQRAEHIDEGWRNSEYACQRLSDGTCHRCDPTGVQCPPDSEDLINEITRRDYAAERANRNAEILGERATVVGFDEAENLKFHRPKRRFKKTAKKSRKPTRPNNSDTWAEVVNHTIGKYVAEQHERLERNSKIAAALKTKGAFTVSGDGVNGFMVVTKGNDKDSHSEPERVNRNPEILESLSKIRDTSGMEFEPDPAKAQARRYGSRYRVDLSRTGAQRRIVYGYISLDGKADSDQSSSWDDVWVYSDANNDGLDLDKFSGKRVLAIHAADWDAGEPYEIDSAWGYATASAKSCKITGEVTRTEEIHQHSFDAYPLADEDFVNFLTEGVRVYFKKS